MITLNAEEMTVLVGQAKDVVNAFYLTREQRLAILPLVLAELIADAKNTDHRDNDARREVCQDAPGSKSPPQLAEEAPERWKGF